MPIDLFRVCNPLIIPIKERKMATKQGDLALLQNPVAQELLQSKHPAQLAYNWTDGTPRVVPIWFHWNGQTFVMAGPARAPKVKALRQNPQVALPLSSPHPGS